MPPDINLTLQMTPELSKMDEFLEEEKLLIPRHRNPIMFDQNLSSLSPSFHRWVINVKFVATPGRSFDGGTFPRQIGLPPVQSGQSAVMERQRRCSGQNLESLITDPPLLKISDPDTLHTAQCAPYWWKRLRCNLFHSVCSTYAVRCIFSAVYL